MTTHASFGLMVVMGLLFLFGIGVAHPHTRPLLIGLVVFICVGAALFGFLVVPHVATVPPTAQEFVIPAPPAYDFSRAATARQQTAEPVVAPYPVQTPGWSAPAPLPTPREISAAETKQPKMNLLAALGQAFVQSWTGRGSPAVAEAPEKPVKTNQTAAPVQPQPPSWVNAPSKLESNCYRTSVHAGLSQRRWNARGNCPKPYKGPWRSMSS